MMSVALTELELTILLKMTCSDPPTPTSHVLGLLSHTWLNSHPHLLASLWLFLFSTSPSPFDFPYIFVIYL